MSNNIHPTAIVDPSAKLSGVKVGPQVLIEKDVVIGEGTIIGNASVIKKGTSIGKNNIITENVIIGGDPQDLGFDIKKNSGVMIGDNNTFREFFTIHRSTKENEMTIVGDNNLFMGSSHVAHDCEIHNNIVIANGSLLAGHTEVMDHAFISGVCTIHQFSKIGRYAMVSALSKINKDVPPFVLTEGYIAKYRTLNVVGLRRGAFSSEERKEIKAAYSVIYGKGLNFKDSLEELKNLPSSNLVQEIINFIESSERGIVSKN